MHHRIRFIILAAIPFLFVPILVARQQASPSVAPVEIEARMEGKRYRGATATSMIDVPPVPLWRVLTDYENDARYYPNTRVSRIIEKNGNRPLELDHPLMTRWLAERLLRRNIPEMYRIITERAREIHMSNAAVNIKGSERI